MTNPYYISELKIDTKKLATEFILGESVQEANLSEQLVEKFNKYYKTIIHNANALKEITEGKAQSYAIQLFEELQQTKRKIMQMNRTAKKEREYLQPIETKYYELNKEYNNKATPTERKETLQVEIQPLSEQIEKHNETSIKNKDLQRLVNRLCERIGDRDLLFLIEEKMQLKDYVTNPEMQHFPNEVIEEISQKLHSDRPFSIFENACESGERLLSFKFNTNTTETVYTYGTDKDIDACKEALEKGVDIVAKKGLYQVTHNTFDLSLNFLHEFSFVPEEGENPFYFHRKEKEKYRFLSNRSIAKTGGLIIFNLPYYKIFEFTSFLNQLTIHGLYRVDDEMKNVLFITSYRKPVTSNNLELQKAAFNYEKLTHYTEAEAFEINPGELVLPKTFRAEFVDDEDILQSFIGQENALSTISDYYTPVEKSIELSQPLQGYKEGHLPSAAVSEICNGIFDTDVLKAKGLIDSSIHFSNLFSTKIIQQEVKERIKEEGKDGKPVIYITNKKRNFIVANYLLPNGQMFELLNSQVAEEAE